MIYTTPDGVQLDFNTGKVVGQVAPAQATPQEARQPTTEVYPGGIKTATDALKQLSFGFNSALFALPDAVIRSVGKAAGLPDEEIPTFVRYFSRGETAPKNAIERFANAIGQGMGGTLPATGVLGAVARTKALSAPLTAGAPITKQIAKETLDFIRANPGKAVALDLGFGGGYGALEQTVEETTEPGTTQDILKAVVPVAGTVAIPVAGNKLYGLAKKLYEISPTRNLFKAATGPGAPPPTGIPERDYVSEAVSEVTPQIPGVKGIVGTFGNWYGSKAQKSISEELRRSLSKESAPDIEEQLALTKRIEEIARAEGYANPEMMFSLPEATLVPALRQAYKDVIASASPQVKAQINERMDQNVKFFTEYAQKLTPTSGLSFDEALAMSAAERTRAMDDALSKVTDLSDAERLRLLDRFDQDANIADIGQNLRSGILIQREALLNGFRTKVDELAARPFGVRAPVRDGIEVPETFPTALFKNFAQGFVKKYNLTPQNRFFSGEVPAPAKDMQRVLNKIRSEEESLLPKILDRKVGENMAKENPNYRASPPEEQAALRKYYVEGIMSGALDSPSYKATMAAAVKEVDDTTKNVAITLPEAMDLLQAAQRYRTHMFLKSQDDRAFGLQANFADQVKRNGEELLRDVEKFVFTGFKDVPGIKDLEDVYRKTFTEGYDNLFPLMATKRTATGEFVMGDQRLIDEALKSRENLRSLNMIFGDNPTYARHLEKAMLSKARAAGVINRDGLLDQQAYNRFLTANTRNGLMDELPTGVQTALRDEMKLGQAFADEVAQKQAAAEALKDAELDKLLKQSLRPDADVGVLVKQALNDPATMKKIISTVGSTPENLEALRRKVWEDTVSKIMDPNDPVNISDFLIRYGKSLNMLYSPEHLKDLNLLSAIQQRVFAVARPEGSLSPFKTFDEKLRERIGAGVGTLESTARAATIRQISPIHAGVSVLTRFFSRQQQSISDKIILKALTDPVYAQRLTAVKAPLDSKKGFDEMSKLTYQVGGFLPSLIRNAPRVASIEATQAAEDESVRRPFAQVPPEMMAPAAPPPPSRPLPAMPQAQGPRPMSMLQQYQQDILSRQRPAPPAAGRPLAQSPVARSVPQMPNPQQSNVNNETYRLLFPNDTVSPMLPRGQ
jgi:hypothetical protein